MHGNVLDDPDELMRCGAAMVPVGLKAVPAVQKLVSMIRSERGSPRKHTTDALSKIATPAVPFLVEATVGR